jgi:hypothetical protein
MKIKSRNTLCATNLLLSLYFFCGHAQAQDRLNSLSETPATLQTVSTETASSSSLANSDYPDAPQAQQTQQASHDSAVEAAQGEGQQTKRILGIFPNFRAVSANVHLPPQTVKEKFLTATQDSFDYSSIFLPAVVAGYNQATNNTPEFRQGAAGYGRSYWHAFVDQANENYFVEFTRNDAGHDTFNLSEVVGAGAAAGVSNLYYPSRERTFSNTADRWGQNIGIDAGTFLFHEFWPDINHALFHGNKPTQ